MKKRKPFFYGWVIVGAAFTAMLIAFGVRYSFPVFYVEILSKFGWSESETAGIFSLSLLVYGIACPITGGLIDRFGAKKIMVIGAIIQPIATAALALANSIIYFYIMFGVIVAIATALVGFIPHGTILSRWFIAKRGTAFGIYSAGFGLSFLASAAADFFISNFGWRMAYVILGALAAAIVLPLVVIFQKNYPEDMGLHPDGASRPPPVISSPVNVSSNVTNWTLRLAMKTQRFWWAFSGGILVWGFGLNMMVVHIVNFAMSMGYTRTFGAGVLSIYGITFATGNVFSFISDRIGREKAITLGCGGAVLGIALLLLVRDASAPWLLYAYAVIAGTGNGIANSTYTAALSDVFPGKGFGTILGFMTTGGAFGAAIGPWLAGYIFETAGNYTWALVTLIAGFTIGCICMWITGPRKVNPIIRTLKAPS